MCSCGPRGDGVAGDSLAAAAKARDAGSIPLRDGTAVAPAPSYLWRRRARGRQRLVRRQQHVRFLVVGQGPRQLQHVDLVVGVAVDLGPKRVEMRHVPVPRRQPEAQLLPREQAVAVAVEAPEDVPDQAHGRAGTATEARLPEPRLRAPVRLEHILAGRLVQEVVLVLDAVGVEPALDRGRPADAPGRRRAERVEVCHAMEWEGAARDAGPRVS